MPRVLLGVALAVAVVAVQRRARAQRVERELWQEAGVSRDLR